MKAWLQYQIMTLTLRVQL